MAVTAPTPEIRAHYLQLALVWDQLADERLAFFLKKDGEPEK